MVNTSDSRECTATPSVDAFISRAFWGFQFVQIEGNPNLIPVSLCVHDEDETFHLLAYSKKFGFNELISFGREANLCSVYGLRVNLFQAHLPYIPSQFNPQIRVLEERDINSIIAQIRTMQRYSDLSYSRETAILGAMCFPDILRRECYAGAAKLDQQELKNFPLFDRYIAFCLRGILLSEEQKTIILNYAHENGVLLY
ncbi:MAG TPA: hypothetical protein PLX79_01880 [Candidatus Dojkabacteria bacterium]|nr:hypothetical protein [Candidatus Dojkabacteria bacterium]